MNRTTKEELEKLIIEENRTYTEISKMFGVSDVTIKQWAIKFGINVPNRKKVVENRKCLNCGKEFKPNNVKKGEYSKYCSQECSTVHRMQENYEKYKLDNSIAYGQKNMRSYKKWFLEEQNYKCDICGINNSWNEKELVFILDHIDGNADNNQRENLRLVCPNCDSQLDTFKSKNKNSARSKYRQTLKIEDCI